jgi:hypothetical protein
MVSQWIKGDIYFADMSMTVSRPHCLEKLDGLAPQRWMGKKILPLHNGCGLDIDYKWQMG